VNDKPPEHDTPEPTSGRDSQDRTTEPEENDPANAEAEEDAAVSNSAPGEGNIDEAHAEATPEKDAAAGEGVSGDVADLGEARTARPSAGNSEPEEGDPTELAQHDELPNDAPKIPDDDVEDKPKDQAEEKGNQGEPVTGAAEESAHKEEPDQGRGTGDDGSGPQDRRLIPGTDEYNAYIIELEQDPSHVGVVNEKSGELAKEAHVASENVETPDPPEKADPFSDEAWAEYESWQEQQDGTGFDEGEISQADTEGDVDERATTDLINDWEKLGESQARAADRLIDGHSLEKHKHEYPRGWSQEKLRDHVAGVINHPDDSESLENGRWKFWNDEMGTFVILNPRDPDGGSFYRPRRGKDYYNEFN
jgi:hypothetical protein